MNFWKKGFLRLKDTAGIGFPQKILLQNSEEFVMIILPRMGRSLEQYLKKPNLPHTAEREQKQDILVAMLACDGAAALLNYHHLAIVHGAVVPENFRIGIKHNNWYLI